MFDVGGRNPNFKVRDMKISKLTSDYHYERQARIFRLRVETRSDCEKGSANWLSKRSLLPEQSRSVKDI